MPLLSLILAILISGCSSFYPGSGFDNTAIYDSPDPDAVLHEKLNQQRKDFVNNRQELPEQIKQDILSGRVSIGMTSDQVIATLGKPWDINRITNANGIFEIWSYKIYKFGVTYSVGLPTNYECRFSNGKLVEIFE